MQKKKSISVISLILIAHVTQANNLKEALGVAQHPYEDKTGIIGACRSGRIIRLPYFSQDVDRLIWSKPDTQSITDLTHDNRGAYARCPDDIDGEVNVVPADHKLNLRSTPQITLWIGSGRTPTISPVRGQPHENVEIHGHELFGRYDVVIDGEVYGRVVGEKQADSTYRAKWRIPTNAPSGDLYLRGYYNNHSNPVVFIKERITEVQVSDALADAVAPCQWHESHASHIVIKTDAGGIQNVDNNYSATMRIPADFPVLIQAYWVDSAETPQMIAQAYALPDSHGPISINARTTQIVRDIHQSEAFPTNLELSQLVRRKDRSFLDDRVAQDLRGETQPKLLDD